MYKRIFCIPVVVSHFSSSIYTGSLYLTQGLVYHSPQYMDVGLDGWQ